jgi:hypothetical protein
MQRRAQSPYNAFKDDQERRRALISRDIRLVLIALVLAFGGPHLSPDVTKWWSQVSGSLR